MSAKSIAAALASKNAFVADKSKVMTAFTSTMLFDYEAIGALVNKYAGKAEFIEMRVACAELAIQTSLVKAGDKCDAALAHELALHDATKEGARKLSDNEKAAKKSARNKWFAFTQKCKIITQETRGGARNLTGNNGAKERNDKPADAPVKIDQILVERVASLVELAAHYTTIKSHLIKFQMANAKAFKGDEGAKLLDKHTRILAILNEA